MKKLAPPARRFRSWPRAARWGALLLVGGLLFGLWPAVIAGSQVADPSELDIDVVPSTPEANSGATVTYVITVTNQDTTAAGPFRVLNELPDETLFVSCQATGAGICGGSGNIRSIGFSSLGPGSSATVEIVASVSCLPDESDIFNTAELIPSVARPDSDEVENETAYVTVRNLPSPDNLTGDVTGPRVVEAGQHLCLTNARFAGAITVNPGGGLSLTNSEVSRGVSTNQAGLVRICGSRIAGGLTVTGSSGPVTVGDGSTGCAGNQFSRPGVTLTGNHAGLVLGGNTVAGTATVSGNSDGGAGSGILVQANTLSANLHCSANTPVPMNGGQPNTVVTGTKTGQCSTL